VFGKDKNQGIPSKIIMAINKFEPIKIRFIKEEAQEKNKKGELEVLKTPQGDISYVRNDLMGLLGLLGRFDTKIHSVKDWKMSIKIKDKMRDAFTRELDEIELTLDEATFVKLYLKELPEKEGLRESIPEYELRTLFGILEQFDREK